MVHVEENSSHSPAQDGTGQRGKKTPTPVPRHLRPFNTKEIKVSDVILVKL
jgi:hypothetical protein